MLYQYSKIIGLWAGKSKVLRIGMLGLRKIHANVNSCIDGFLLIQMNGRSSAVSFKYIG